MQASKLGYRQRALAIFLFATNLKGTSSMHLHRDLGIAQSNAWHMGHRVRKLWEQASEESFEGPVEFDEAFFGGREHNKRLRENWKAGKVPVAGARDHASGQISARVVPDVTREVLRRPTETSAWNEPDGGTGGAHQPTRWNLVRVAPSLSARFRPRPTFWPPENPSPD